VAVPGQAGSRRHADVTKSEHCNFHPVTIALGRAAPVQAKGLSPKPEWLPIRGYSGDEPTLDRCHVGKPATHTKPDHIRNRLRTLSDGIAH
jgi:hypothetical protein